MGMFCPLHSLMETVKSTNLDFSNKLSMKMIKGMMTSDFWRVISEVIRGGELLTRGRCESKLTRHKGQFLSSFANNPSPPPSLGPVLERCKVITEQCAKSIGRKLSTRLKLVREHRNTVQLCTIVLIVYIRVWLPIYIEMTLSQNGLSSQLTVEDVNLSLMLTPN